MCMFERFKGFFSPCINKSNEHKVIRASLILTRAWTSVLNIYTQKVEINVLHWIFDKWRLRVLPPLKCSTNCTYLFTGYQPRVSSCFVALDEKVAGPALACLFCMFAWIADNSDCCLHKRREPQTFLWSPRPCRAAGCLSQSSTSRGIGLIFCSRRIRPWLFCCCTQRSRSLTETMGLIWIIKEVRHYDTVSLCREGRLANIQEHWLSTTDSPLKQCTVPGLGLE